MTTMSKSHNLTTVFKSRIDQASCTVQQLPPVVVHHLSDQALSRTAEVVDLLVVPRGPQVVVGEDEADNEEDQVDGRRCQRPGSPVHCA